MRLGLALCRVCIMVLWFIDGWTVALTLSPTLLGITLKVCIIFMLAAAATTVLNVVPV